MRAMFSSRLRTNFIVWRQNLVIYQLCQQVPHHYYQHHSHCLASAAMSPDMACSNCHLRQSHHSSAPSSMTPSPTPHNGQRGRNLPKNQHLLVIKVPYSCKQQIMHAKSQTNSKQFFQVDVSSKKGMNEFYFTTMKYQVNLFSFIFWRKLKTPKRHFESN